jgi:hypothetical protein
MDIQRIGNLLVRGLDWSEGAEPRLTRSEAEAIIAAERPRCGFCGAPNKLTVDHYASQQTRGARPAELYLQCSRTAGALNFVRNVMAKDQDRHDWIGLGVMNRS